MEEWWAIQDQSKFNITSGGILSFKSPPDFESPTDLNGDNVYIVIVEASDGTLTNLQAILVSVTNTTDVPLAGDHNNSGTVDIVDYVVWRNALGQAVTLPNDSTPGSVTQEDYDVWRANFGRTTSTSANATALVGTLIEPVNGNPSARRPSQSFIDSTTRTVQRQLLPASPVKETTKARTGPTRPARHAVGRHLAR